MKRLYKEEGIRYKRVAGAPEADWRRGVISAHAIEVITPYLEDVTDPKINGTGRNLKGQGLHRCGKDGYRRNRQQQKPRNSLVRGLPHGRCR